MRNIGIAFLFLGLVNLSFALMHLGLLPTMFAVHPNPKLAISYALGFVVLGIDGAVVLRRVWWHRRLK